MLDKKTAKLINEQVTLEFYSAYLYLDFANFYTDQGLDGFAHWFEIQAQEERDHAMLMRTYLQTTMSMSNLAPSINRKENIRIS